MIVRVHRNCGLIEDGASLVKADEAFLRVNLPVELEHALSELCVCDNAAIFSEGQRAGEARLNVDFAAIYATQERANDCGLVVWATQVVIEDVRDDRGMDRTRQVFNVDAEIEVRQVCLLAGDLIFLCY